jgi:hypothetical protein
VGPHESMTCGVHGIYLKFGSFNGIDPIVPKINHIVLIVSGIIHSLTPLMIVMFFDGRSNQPLTRAD